MRADEFLKKYGLDGDDDDLKDTSLRGKSHAGTPHDWEDWERFRAEEKAAAAGKDDKPADNTAGDE